MGRGWQPAAVLWSSLAAAAIRERTMFGNKSDPTRVYAFGAKAPRGETSVLVDEQFERARQYRNALVEIELSRRADVNEVVTRRYPRLVVIEEEIAGLDAEIEEQRDAIKRANMRQRRRSPDPAVRASIKDLKARKRPLWEEHKALRRKAYGDRRVDPPIPGDSVLGKALSAIDAEDRARRKALRAEHSDTLHWGTRGAVERGLGRIRSGAPPRFVSRVAWPGKLAVQLQASGTRPSPTWEELKRVGHGQARVRRITAEGGTGRRSKRPFYELYLRIGSEGSEGVYATVEFVLHRHLPADGQIKWIYLVRRRTGTHWRYSVQFVVARKSWVPHDTTNARGLAAMNLGFRRIGLEPEPNCPDTSEIRVATLVDDRGHVEHLTVPANKTAVLVHAASLRSSRDREFDHIRASFARWLTENEAPGWLREATASLPQWRSEARLAALVRRWREQRFDGDSSVFERLEAWRAQDRHIYDWESAERTKFRRWRDDHYRRWVATLRWRYERVGVEAGEPWAATRRRPSPEVAEDPEVLNTRYRASVASPGRLRQLVESGHPGAKRVDPAGVTTTCSTCGAQAADDWDRVSDLDFRCAAGHRLDQDVNAAQNLLAKMQTSGVAVPTA